MRNRSGERGQSLTEFALTLPILILVLLGVLDLSRVFQAKLTLANAAREGARYGMDAPPNMRKNSPFQYTANIKGRTEQEASNSGVTILASEITVTCIPSTGGAPVACDDPTVVGGQVQVTILHAFNMISTALFGVSSLNITGFATMVITN